MKTLAKQIAARIGEQAFCVVFEDDLERYWPRNEMAEAKRKTEIQNFAHSHGWTAAILEGAFGTRAIFEGCSPAIESPARPPERTWVDQLSDVNGRGC